MHPKNGLHLCMLYEATSIAIHYQLLMLLSIRAKDTFRTVLPYPNQKLDESICESVDTKNLDELI